MDSIGILPGNFIDGYGLSDPAHHRGAIFICPYRNLFAQAGAESSDCWNAHQAVTAVQSWRATRNMACCGCGRSVRSALLAALSVKQDCALTDFAC